LRDKRALAVGMMLAAVTVNGCVFGHPGRSASSSSGLGDRNLAQPAQLQPDSNAATATASGTDSSSTAASNDATAQSGGAPSPHGTIAQIVDPSGDAGAPAPAYADAVGVEVDDLGSSVRVTVRLAGTVPAALGSGEVEGIGVNLTPADQSAPSYQLFADGEVDGWFGYLEVGDQFVGYPGTFDLAGAALVFTVPWSALGDLRAGTADAFVDWSKPTIGNAAQSTSDRAPDAGSVAFSR